MINLLFLIYTHINCASIKKSFKDEIKIKLICIRLGLWIFIGTDEYASLKNEVRG